MSRILSPHGGAGAPPPVALPGPTVDEGPMRSELLRQIRRLELETSHFQTANGVSGAASPLSRRRGPALLTAAQLEQIRDELLDVRAALHEIVIARVQQDDAPEPRRSRRLSWRRVARP